MFDAVILFLVLTFFMMLPLWVAFRWFTSQDTRSHLWALILHDLITWIWSVAGRLVVGALRLVPRGVTILASVLAKVFRP